MVARVAAASLGLLAFSVSLLAGLYVQNPATVTLSRSILALFVFCLIGLVLGGAAQLVIAEHEKTRESAIRKQYGEDSTPPAAADSEGGADGGPPT